MGLLEHPVLAGAWQVDHHPHHALTIVMAYQSGRLLCILVQAANVAHAQAVLLLSRLLGGLYQVSMHDAGMQANSGASFNPDVLYPWSCKIFRCSFNTIVFAHCTWYWVWPPCSLARVLLAFLFGAPHPPLGV